MASFEPVPCTMTVVVGVDAHLLGASQVGQLDVFQLLAQVFEDRLAAGEDRDVFQHRLATIAVAGSLDGTHLQDAPQLVDHQRRQGFAFDVLGDDQQRRAVLRDLLQQRHQVAGVGDLLFVNEDAAVVQLDGLVVLVGDEVRREVTPLELHPFDEFDLGLHPAAFFDRDDAVLADLHQGVGESLADFLVVVAGDGRDGLDRLFVFGDRPAWPSS